MNSLNRPVVIFGDRSMASLTWHSLVFDAGRIVAGFTVENKYRIRNFHEGLPVVSFDEVESIFPPAQFEMIIPVGATQINGARRALWEIAKSKGYTLANLVSQRAHIWPDTPVGDNCLIFDQAVVQPFVRIGNNVIVRSGANIGHHSVIEDHCFIATGVITGGNVTIGEQCFVGIGAVIRDGIKLASRCLIGAGAVVMADTEADRVYVGNPARRMNQLAIDF
jgi:sugar O-acyltransferase (sialic acid O-acetyltransferase NeuD family)